MEPEQEPEPKPGQEPTKIQKRGRESGTGSGTGSGSGPVWGFGVASPIRNVFRWENFPTVPRRAMTMTTSPGVEAFRRRVNDLSMADSTKIVALKDMSEGLPITYTATGESGKVEVGREIGMGGFGRVYLSKDSKYAAKIQLEDDTLRELMAFAIIECTACSPAAQRWKEKYQSDGIPVLPLLGYSPIIFLHAFNSMPRGIIFTEYLPKGLVSEMGVSARLFTDMLRDVITGLSYIHLVCQFVHGDIKPNNIGINSKGRFVLFDFGKACDFLDENGRIRGNTRVERCTAGTRVYYPEEHFNALALCPTSDLVAATLMLSAIAGDNDRLKEQVLESRAWLDSTPLKKAEILSE